MTNGEWTESALEAMADFDDPEQAIAAYRRLVTACTIFLKDYEHYNQSSLRTWVFNGVADIRAEVSAIQSMNEN